MPLHEVAKSLHSHPATIIFSLASLGALFEDYYPDVEENWIETLKGLDWKYFEFNDETFKNQKKEFLSNTAKKILDKLERKKHYGKHYVSLTTIRNHYCPNQPDFEEAIEALIGNEFIIEEEDKGLIIINTSKNKEIEQVLNSFRQ